MPFSQPHADAACNFFELVLKHSADDWYGKPFILAPWQIEALEQIFGQLDEHGNRIIEMAYIEVPKKAGKTEWAAGLLLLVLILTDSRGCQIYGAASATRQAMNVYRAACKMVEQSPILSKRLRILRGTNRIIKRSDPDSFYAAIAADGDFGDGVNPACVIADEVHRWKTRKHLENWDVLSNGGITRRQTLTIAITTAGVKSESPLAWRLHEKARKIQEGVIEDPKFYGRIYAADPKDDWKAEATWVKANPSLLQNGGFLGIEKYREKYESAVGDPEAQRTFRRYFLNLWDEKTNRVIDMQRWKESAGPWQAVGLLEREPGQACRTFPHEFLSRFFGRRCWAGVDLSETTDMTALVLLFPVEDSTGNSSTPAATNESPENETAWDVLAFPWLPEENLANRERRDGMPFRTWVEQGFLEVCPGRFIDYREVKARLRWARELFDLQEVCFDPRNSLEISPSLVDEGFEVIHIEQTVLKLNEPTKKVLRSIVAGKFHHGGHPVLTWHASCMSTINNNDLIRPAKPEREKDTARIDLMAAAITAMHRAMVAPGGISYAGLRSVG